MSCNLSLPFMCTWPLKKNQSVNHEHWWFIHEPLSLYINILLGEEQSFLVCDSFNFDSKRFNTYQITSYTHASYTCMHNLKPTTDISHVISSVRSVEVSGIVCLLLLFYFFLSLLRCRYKTLKKYIQYFPMVFSQKTNFRNDDIYVRLQAHTSWHSRTTLYRYHP